MADKSPDFLAILEILADYKIDFIIVGGVCAVLHGAPVTTFDLDVVHKRIPENLERLMSALQELDAYYRSQFGRKLKPDLFHLASAGHQLLITRFGPFDLLGTIGKGHSYEDLVSFTTELQISKNLKIRLLNLETLIAIKEEVLRDTDKAMLPILRRTLEEKLKMDR